VLTTMIKRHFPPPTFRSHFSPERAFPPPPFAFRTTFPLEGLSFPDTSPNKTPTLEDTHILGPPYNPSQRNVSGQSGLIPKPKGEVNRADTYNLKRLCEEQLGWSTTHFEEIQVGLVHSIDEMLNNICFKKKYLHELIDTNLDKEASRTQQTIEMKRLVYDEV
jgi:hypothetical protein